MNNRVVCNIKVRNIMDNTVWEHRRVPEDHAETLSMSPNLEVEVIKRYHLFNDRNKNRNRLEKTDRNSSD